MTPDPARPRLLLDLALPPIPTSQVRLTVEVDRRRCVTMDPQVDGRLLTLERDGPDTTVDELVALSAMHFVNAAIDRGHGIARAELRNAWAVLADWNVTAVPHARQNRPVLVVTPQDASRVNATRAEVLGIGVALGLATFIYDLPSPNWLPSAGLDRHDLEGRTADGRLVRVAARARLSRRHRWAAVRDVYDKFAAADFARAAGIIFCPPMHNRTTAEDVLVVDPSGDLMAQRTHEQFRSVLLH